MDKNKNFYAFLSRMKYINRWGLMRNTWQEKIQEHSLQVAVFAHALALIKNLYFKGNANAQKAALTAMFHDSAEIITGDMPTPIKYFNVDIKRAYNEIEDASKLKMLQMLPDELSACYEELFFCEDKETETIVKAADKLAAYIKCIEEIKSGNNEFAKAKESIYLTLKDMRLEELDYFMDNFIESFELSLDEF